MQRVLSRVFQIVVRGVGEGGKFPPVGGIGNFAGRIFLPGDEKLRENVFDNSNLFQSKNSIL